MILDNSKTTLLKNAIGLPVNQPKNDKVEKLDSNSDKTKLLKSAIRIPNLEELYVEDESESPEDKQMNKSIALMNILGIDSKKKMFEKLWERHFLAHFEFWTEMNSKKKEGKISHKEMNFLKFHALYDAWWDYWDNFWMKRLTKIEYNMKDFYEEFLSYYEIEVDNFDYLFKEWKNVRYNSDTFGVLMLNDDLSKIVFKTFKFNGSWSLPKGKKLWYKEESDIKAALRESEEETGFNCENYIIPSEYLDLKINNSNCKLYLAVGISNSTEFNPNCKGESDQAEFISFKDLGNKKKKVSLLPKQINDIKNWIESKKDIILKFGVSKNLTSLVRNINPNKENIYECGNTLLHIAIKNNNLELVKLLVSNGFNINYINKDQYSPLMLAALEGNHDILSLLVDRQDIILDKRNSCGCTALGYLALSKKYNMKSLKLLLRKRCDIFITLDHIYNDHVVKIPLYYLFLSSKSISRISHNFILKWKKNGITVKEDSKNYNCF